jgi:hypothetical protein
MALDANTVWEIRTDGNANYGGGFAWLSLVSATYRWTASGSGTNEYYCEAAAGGDPSLTEAKCCSLNGAFTLATNGTLGSLNASEWDWGDNDSLGYNTVYVRLADGADPDSKEPGFVQMGKGGGYDYSQQAAAQLTLTDLACAAASTTLTSATGGFTALMVYNVIHIVSGTNDIPGWYQITAYSDTNTVTIDRTCATGGDMSAATGSVGGVWEFGTAVDDDFFEAKVAGNIVFIKSGTHATLGETIAASPAGTGALLIRVIGYDTSRAVRPTGDNRPLIQCGAYYFQASSGGWWTFENLRGTGTSSFVFYFVGGNCLAYNCKVTNSSGVASRVAFQGGSGTTNYFICCEGISTNGTAFTTGVFVHCYAHDSVTTFTGGTLMLFCVSDTGSTYGVSQASGLTMNNTFYGNGTGLYISATTTMSIVINNIFDGNTTGIDASGAKGSTLLLFNSFDNTTDLAANVAGAIQDGNQTGDPGLNNPAAGDFSITSGDAEVYQTALDVQVYTGAIVRS